MRLSDQAREGKAWSVGVVWTWAGESVWVGTDRRGAGWVVGSGTEGVVGLPLRYTPLGAVATVSFLSNNLDVS